MPNVCPTVKLRGRGPGPERNEVLINTVWIDPGATAADPEDGDLTDEIFRDASAVDTKKPGVYRVTYSVTDAAGCSAQAIRYVRVIALIATSDAQYLSQLCVRQVPTVAMTCELGMNRQSDNLPNTAAFPACCLVVSEMDSAACFCDGAVVGEMNARNETFFQNLLDFTPMACGFRIKTGEVCTDMKALESFLTEETLAAAGNDTSDVASVEELISEGGALDDSLPCESQVEAAAAMCQRLTRTTPGPAPLVADFVPCCSAVSVLDSSQCLCDPDVLTGDRTTFLQQLIGFSPLGCGFALTASCPEVSDQLALPSFEVPDAFTPEGIPQVLPIAGGETAAAGNETTWEFLLPPVTTTTTPPPTTTTSVVDVTTGEELLSVVDGEKEQLFNMITCGEYLAMAPEACGAVKLSARVSTFELTTCCAFLHAAHARGCLCPPVGLFRLNAVNPDLQVIAPAACALRLDSPPPLGPGSCKTKLTLEQVMSPAEAIAAEAVAEMGREQGSSALNETTGGASGGGGGTAGGVDSEGVVAAGGPGSAEFFDARNITLGSLAFVAEEATPILVTTATTLTVMESSDDNGGEGGVVTTASEHEIPLGSVIGVISEDAFAALEEDGDIEATLSVNPFAVLQPGATYGVPSGAVITSNVTSVSTTTTSGGGGATAVTVGGDDRVVVTIPDLNGTVQVPWTASLAPVPLIEEANYDEDASGQLPVAVVTNQVSGVTSLIPLSVDTPAEEIRAEIAAAEGGASDVSGGGGGLIYGTSDDTGLGKVIPSSTASCLFDVIIAEASCIPMLENVESVFELDMGWRVCCARIQAVDDNRCFCDGAVAAALDVSSRSTIHERIMDAIPGACGFKAGGAHSFSLSLAHTHTCTHTRFFVFFFFCILIK